jgi:hypothetical protein
LISQETQTPMKERKCSFWSVIMTKMNVLNIIKIKQIKDKKLHDAQVVMATKKQ